MRHSSQHEHIVVRFEHDWMNEIWDKKVPFLAVFFVVCTLTYGALYALDFYPELTYESKEIQDEWAITPVVVATEEARPRVARDADAVAVTAQNALPVRIVIDALKRDVAVLNPTETTIEALDAALLKGVIRHPDSADFKKTGTMFLLGHSSYLPTVHNRNFQAFNGIQKLVKGDTIRVRSADTEYLYSVTRVYEAKASNAEADIQWATPKLIMVTCDTFGAKDDRFVVEADFVKSYPIQG